jgi:kinesin family protein 18/19
MIATVSPASSQNEETINTLKYANRAKNIKMRVEPNKKLVTLHISAYKNIISDLRDEIDQLKAQLASDFDGQGFAPTKTQQALEFKKYYQIEAQRKLIEENAQSLRDKNRECNCESITKDEEVKRTIQQDISRSYEEIIQLEQALIELDEQNTVNSMEIKKREAKVFLIKKQMEENEQELKSKENQVDHEQITREQARLLKIMRQEEEQI